MDSLIRHKDDANRTVESGKWKKKETPSHVRDLSSKRATCQDRNSITTSAKKRRIESGLSHQSTSKIVNKLQVDPLLDAKVILEENFKNQLVKSLVPQAVIDSTGTILFYNEPFEMVLRHCFTSRLSSTESTRTPLTIFALVDIDQLAMLFKSFSEALRICTTKGRNERRANCQDCNVTPSSVNIVPDSQRGEARQEWRCSFPCQRSLTYSNSESQGRRSSQGYSNSSTVDGRMDQQRLNLSLSILERANVSSDGIYFLGVCIQSSIEKES